MQHLASRGGQKSLPLRRSSRSYPPHRGRSPPRLHFRDENEYRVRQDAWSRRLTNARRQRGRGTWAKVLRCLRISASISSRLKGEGESARGLLARGTGRNRDDAPNHNEELTGYMTCFQQYSAKGITSAGIAGSESVHLPVDAGQGNPVRVGFMFTYGYFDALQAAGIERGFGDDRLRVTASKNYQGNSLSGRTAWLSEAYYDRPDYFGIPPART